MHKLKMKATKGITFEEGCNMLIISQIFRILKT